MQNVAPPNDNKQAQAVKEPSPFSVLLKLLSRVGQWLLVVIELPFRYIFGSCHQIYCQREAHNLL